MKYDEATRYAIATRTSRYFQNEVLFLYVTRIGEGFGRGDGSDEAGGGDEMLYRIRVIEHRHREIPFLSCDCSKPMALKYAAFGHLHRARWWLSEAKVRTGRHDSEGTRARIRKH